ncbi:unnamed protein product [Allacma fusca]|uniref:Uncharacterized protein n=1 Tax=Allacma fusca TaxID=39272 RepID=A0A8J2L9T6_9HEXA|nr:unnamed protein product [Allacma fusca]
MSYMRGSLKPYSASEGRGGGTTIPVLAGLCSRTSDALAPVPCESLPWKGMSQEFGDYLSEFENALNCCSSHQSRPSDWTIFDPETFELEEDLLPKAAASLLLPPASLKGQYIICDAKCH